MRLIESPRLMSFGLTNAGSFSFDGMAAIIYVIRKKTVVGIASISLYCFFFKESSLAFGVVLFDGMKGAFF